MKKFISLFMAFVMLLTFTSGINFTVLADSEFDEDLPGVIEPSESIDYVEYILKNPYKIKENTNGYWAIDSNGYEYYHYKYNVAAPGSSFVVHYLDKTEKIYYEDNGEFKAADGTMLENCYWKDIPEYQGIKHWYGGKTYGTRVYTCGVYTDVEITIVKNTPQDISSGFKIGKDNNSYCHYDNSYGVQKTSGFVDVEDYKIDKEYYKRLVNNSSMIEKIQIKKMMNRVWEGSCYGIATTLGMVYQNIIPLSSITSKSNVKDYYHLPYPYKDKTLLNSIQYFQLSQNLKKGGTYDSAISLTVSNNNLKNKEYDYDNLKTFLKKLVKQASNGRTSLFGFTYKNDGDISGHAILITGCKYDSENKRYIVKLYDENSVGDDSKGNFDKLIISSDFRNFYWSNENLNNKTYIQMYFLDWSRMKQLDGSVKASRQAKEMINSNQAELTFSLDDSFEIVNSSGKNLKYDGGDFSGDMNVYSFDVDSNGIDSSCNATVSIDSSDYYTVYSPTGNVDFQLSDDTNFVSLSAESASNIEVSLENGIEFNGNNSPFIAYMNTDELVAENETNLISVSGVVNGKTVITENNNIVKATNENGIKNAEISNYVETDGNTVKYDKDKVSIDSSDLSDKNTGGSTGGGGTTSSPVPNGTDKKDDDKKSETKPNQSQNTSISATQKLSVRKLVSKKKALVVYWNKIANVSGYQIQVATDKKFKKNKKTVTVAKQNASKKTVKKLKAKKKYFVRVRAYKKVNGKKSYGKWSKIKSVKTK